MIGANQVLYFGGGLLHIDPAAHTKAAIWPLILFEWIIDTTQQQITHQTADNRAIIRFFILG